MNSLLSAFRLTSSAAPAVSLQQLRGISGVVKFFQASKGWGIITSSEEPPREIFVHQSSINMEGYRTLEEAQQVEFEVANDERGPKAVNVVPKSLPEGRPRGGGGGAGGAGFRRDGGGFRDGGFRDRDGPRRDGGGGFRREGGNGGGFRRDGGGNGGGFRREGGGGGGGFRGRSGSRPRDEEQQ